MSKKGLFIVLEGLDRSGKTSIARLLKNRLSQKGPTQLMNFPDRTTAIGKMINDFLINKVELGNEAIHLLFSANRWENMKRINDTLKQGINIVCDRYWYSGVAYSTAKGLDYKWCVTPDQGLIKPDLVIYLSADPEILSKRANYGEERFERLEFQSKVKKAFDLMFESETNTQVKMIDVGVKSLKEVENEVQKIINELIV